MPEQDKQDKAVEEKRDITKTTEYRRFKRLLRQVIKSPPLRRQNKVDRPKPA
jgi:hypothetical protein